MFATKKDYDMNSAISLYIASNGAGVHNKSSDNIFYAADGYTYHDNTQLNVFPYIRTTTSNHRHICLHKKDVLNIVAHAKEKYYSGQPIISDSTYDHIKQNSQNTNTTNVNISLHKEDAKNIVDYAKKNIMLGNQ